MTDSYPGRAITWHLLPDEPRDKHARKGGLRNGGGSFPVGKQSMSTSCPMQWRGLEAVSVSVTSAWLCATLLASYPLLNKLVHMRDRIVSREC